MSTFPILRLPLVLLQNVVAFWNPLEVLNFAMISAKNKSIAKQATTKKPSTIELIVHKVFEFRLQFSANKKDDWCFQVLRSPADYNSYFRPIDRESLIYSDNVFSEGLKVLKQLMEIFGCVFEKTICHSDNSNIEQLHLVIDFINNCPQESIPHCTLSEPSNERRMIPIVERYHKKTKTLRILRGIFDNEHLEPFKFNENLEVEILRMICEDRVKLDTLLTMNCQEAIINESYLRNKDFHEFLKSWMSGESNLRLKSATFETRKRINLKTIFKGLQPLIRDPRNVKRSYMKTFSCFNPRPEERWIYGGIDIVRNDGKVATVTTVDPFIRHPNNENYVPQKAIEIYDDAMNWNYDIEEEEVLENVVGEDEFFVIIIW